MDGAKGDMALGKGWLVESKSTLNDSFSVKYEHLGKIANEALIEGKTPALTVSFVDRNGRAASFGDWVLVPKAAFQEMIGGTVDGIQPAAQKQACR